MLRCFQRTQREQPAAEPELRFPAVRLPESMIEQRQQAVLPWLSYQTIMEDQVSSTMSSKVLASMLHGCRLPWQRQQGHQGANNQTWQAPDGPRAVQAQ